MEANKFEQEIHQKFNQRKIQPSDSAWERLSDKLDAEGQQKKKGWLLYIGYAASIALIISLFFLGNTDETETPENTIVLQEITVPKIDGKLNLLKEPAINKEVFTSNSLSKTVENTVKSEEKKKPSIIKKKELFKNQNLLKTDKSVIAQKPKTNFENTIDPNIDKTINFKETVENGSAIFNNKLENQNKLIDSSKFISKTSISVDSDALLFAVTHSKEEIRGYYKKYRISQAKVLKTIQDELNKNNLKINPSTILAEVEREVNEESFQNNFYQFIKKRVSDVAVAIANRNN
tara:strand:- start:4521 stop:5393 length:873 start_codon:yes stop_codon:yes gene_type:complete